MAKGNWTNKELIRVELGALINTTIERKPKSNLNERTDNCLSSYISNPDDDDDNNDLHLRPFSY